MKIFAFLLAFSAASAFGRSVECYDRHDTLLLTMTGSQDKVETLKVVYKGIDLGTFKNHQFKSDSFDDIELDISETINYGDVYLWMMWGRVRWFTWARTDGTASRFRGKTYCHDID